MKNSVTIKFQGKLRLSRPLLTHHLHQVLQLHPSDHSHPYTDHTHLSLMITNWLNTHHSHISVSGLAILCLLSLSIDSASYLHGLHHLHPSVFTCKKEKSTELSVTVGWIALNCDSPDRFPVLFQQSVNKSPITAESLVSSSVTWQKTGPDTKWNPQWKRELPIHLLSSCIPSDSHISQSLGPISDQNPKSHNFSLVRTSSSMGQIHLGTGRPTHLIARWLCWPLLRGIWSNQTITISIH